MINFNEPHITGSEIPYIVDAHQRKQLAGDGYYTKRCSSLLQDLTNSRKVLLTHSCTAALEIAALLLNIKPGDEIIMPSYTFVSTANAFVLRGAIPVFVDIRADTLNINEAEIEAAITARTRAIVPVHYGGVACEMDLIMDIAKRHNLLVIEDAAQGLMSTYKGRALGSIGDMGAYSFHESKNIISGEGGSLLLNDSSLIARAEIVREKGTNRGEFFRGQVDKYTWVDVGSSYLPGEIIAAFLLAQLENAKTINTKRLELWNTYHSAFEALEKHERFLRPIIPKDCKHNGHIYYLLLRDLDDRTYFINSMKQHGINCSFHYVPLHSSPAGQKYGKAIGQMSVTNNIADRLVRLPIWVGLEDQQKYVIDTVHKLMK